MQQDIRRQALVPAPARPPMDLINIGALLTVLWRGKAVILAAAALAVLVGGFYAFFVAPPTYRATAVVMLDPREERIVDLESVLSGLSSDTSILNSEVEVLRSRSLLGGVVQALDLVHDPEFNAELRNPSLIARLKTAIKAVIRVPGPGPLSDARQLDAVVSALLHKLTIRNIPQTLVFEITVATQDPEKSARIADQLAAAYIAMQLAVKNEATDQATAWLAERVGALQIELEAAEARAQAFANEAELVTPEMLAALEVRVKELRDRIASAPMRGESDAQIAALQQAAQETERRIARQSADLIALQQLSREAEASRQLYEHFLARYKETAAQKGLQQADSRVLSNAVVPLYPASPRKTLVVMIAAIMGAALGAGAVLWREARVSSFRTARELASATSYPVLGQMPLIAGATGRDRLTYLAAHPISPAAEALRNLRTSLLLSNIDLPPQVILSASAQPHEGKTAAAMALAQNFAAMGKRVLLIEGDIRWRAAGTYLGQLPERGLLSLLAGDYKLGDVVTRDPLLGADILAGERTDLNAADLYSSDAFRALMAEIRGIYDIVVIDTPPVLLAPDARILAQYADAVFLCVRWHHTTRAQVQDALAMFESVGRAPAGLVLCQIDLDAMRRY